MPFKAQRLDSCAYLMSSTSHHIFSHIYIYTYIQIHVYFSANFASRFPLLTLSLGYQPFVQALKQSASRQITQFACKTVALASFLWRQLAHCHPFLVRHIKVFCTSLTYLGANNSTRNGISCTQ